MALYLRSALGEVVLLMMEARCVLARARLAALGRGRRRRGAHRAGKIADAPRQLATAALAAPARRPLFSSRRRRATVLLRRRVRRQQRQQLLLHSRRRRVVLSHHLGRLSLGVGLGQAEGDG